MMMMRATMTNKLSKEAFKAELVSLIPHLRAFARSLCDDITLADDIAQETMLKAWKARDSFKPNTNMKAWAFTILRNHFYSERRRSWRRTHLDPEMAETTLVAGDDASQRIELLAVRNALKKLPDEQREAVILVGAGGLSYEEAATVCGCAVGTIKSRINRGRKALEALLEGTDISFSDDAAMPAGAAFGELVDEAQRISKSPS